MSQKDWNGYNNNSNNNNNNYYYSYGNNQQSQEYSKHGNLQYPPPSDVSHYQQPPNSNQPPSASAKMLDTKRKYNDIGFAIAFALVFVALLATTGFGAVAIAKWSSKEHKTSTSHRIVVGTPNRNIPANHGRSVKYMVESEEQDANKCDLKDTASTSHGLAGCPYQERLKREQQQRQRQGTLASEVDPIDPDTFKYSPVDLGIMIGGTIVFGAITSLVYYVLLQKYAGKMIVASIVAQVFLCLSSFVTSIIRKNTGGAITFGILLVFLVWFYYSTRHRIPFAKVVLKAVTNITAKYPATVFAGFMALVCQLFLFAAVAVSIVGIVFYSLDKSDGNVDGGIISLISLFMSFVLLWASEVIRNVLHVTVSGVFATYYFFGISTGGKVTVSVSNPTAASFKRAVTTSFGSICYGSLLIALVRMIKQMIAQMQRDAQENGNMLGCFVAACAHCIVNCIGNVLEYLNHYAFTQVAIYGKDYCTAAKDTWALAKSRGIDALINDSIIGTVLGLGSLSVGIITAAFAIALVHFLPSIKGEAINYLIFSLSALLIGSLQFTVVAEVLTSGVATTFVCLAEEPHALARTKPELYNKVREVYPNIVL